MVGNPEAPPLHPHHVDYLFEKCGCYLTMFHFVDEEPPPLQAIGLNLVAEVDHFGWEMIRTSHSCAISNFDDDFLCGLGKFYQGLTVGAKCSC